MESVAEDLERVLLVRHTFARICLNGLFKPANAQKDLQVERASKNKKTPYAADTGRDNDL